MPASADLVAIVLAAGAGTRFGGGKLTAPFRGEPLLFHAIRAARAAPVARVLVVCAPGLDIGEWPGEPPVNPVPVSSPALSRSLATGIDAAHGAAGAFIFLGDMPLVPHRLAARLAPLLAQRFAVQPVHAGHPGHPVLLSASAFPAVATLTGDAGAGRLLRGRDDVVRIETAEEGCVLDVDRAEDIARLEARITPGG